MRYGRGLRRRRRPGGPSSGGAPAARLGPARLGAAGGGAATAGDDPAEPAFAAERARRWAASPSLQVVVPDADDHHRALIWLERWRDPGVNLADCWAWAVMDRMRIGIAFTTSEPYRWAGHSLLE
jgi:hypothetical protein